MTLKDDIALLAAVPLFDRLDEDKLRLIAFGSERRRLAAGQMLFREGTPADCAFVVADGRFELKRAGRDGAQRDAGIVARGTLLGEIALVSPVKRQMSVFALTDGEVMRISRPLFHRMLEEYPEVAELMKARIAQSFKRMLDELSRLAPRFRA